MSSLDKRGKEREQRERLTDVLGAKDRVRDTFQPKSIIKLKADRGPPFTPAINGPALRACH